MFCPNCGTECNGNFCPNCGTKLEAPKPPQAAPAPSQATNQATAPYIKIEDPKGKWPAFFLCLFLGWLGAHRFYTRKYISALIYIVMLFLAPWALPVCIIYDLITIVTNSFFWDHNEMVARYQASENKSKIDGWMIAFAILALLLIILVATGEPFNSGIEMTCAIGLPIFGVLTLDTYRKGKPYTMPLFFCLICLLPFVANALGIVSLSV